MVTYSVYSLGDSAATIEFGNSIDEHTHNKVLSAYHYLKSHYSEMFLDIVIAYNSLSVIYDSENIRRRDGRKTIFNTVKQVLEEASNGPDNRDLQTKTSVRIPVCYHEDFSPDMQLVCECNNISREDCIQLHTSAPFRVYMLGFLPGFAYLGRLPEKLVVRRKRFPVTVEKGSVGIAGDQTGIYPVTCPGGWNVIGRTPIKLFDPYSETPVVLEPGSLVHFYPISRAEFEEMSGTSDGQEMGAEKIVK